MLKQTRKRVKKQTKKRAHRHTAKCSHMYRKTTGGWPWTKKPPPVNFLEPHDPTNGEIAARKKYFENNPQNTRNPFESLTNPKMKLYLQEASRRGNDMRKKQMAQMAQMAKNQYT